LLCQLSYTGRKAREYTGIDGWSLRLRDNQAFLLPSQAFRACALNATIQ
jgi:hypothetical protein